MKEHKIYSDNIEGKALDQFYSALKNDWVVKAALMPDAHAGYSLPIGAVVSTNGVIVPSWVGYDIGCGMCAIKTGFILEDVKRNSQDIFNNIYGVVPVGFNHHEKRQKFDYSELDRSDFLDKQFKDKGLYQVGTLGGGNHFIEIGSDEDDRVWIIIHSGSRNIGHRTATHYMKIASNSDRAKEGHYFLDSESLEGKLYIKDLEFCLQFALSNRKAMIDRVNEVIGNYCHQDYSDSDFINRNHNHAELRDGNWIHRKGATHADTGMMGVIPANMRDGSFIVEGLGNPDSLWSSSHGAGRVMSRSQAKREVDLDEFTGEMKGVVAKVDSSTLDESPFAYKNIFDVMENQKDLVKVIHHVKPIINIKG